MSRAVHGAVGLAGEKLSKERKKILLELVVDLVEQYVKRAVRNALQEKKEEHRKMAMIAKRWLGLNKQDVFEAWKLFTRVNLNNAAKDAAKMKRADTEKENGVCLSV